MKIIAWLLLAVTAASIVADFFLVSIFLLYWQVVGFIINVSLLYGVKVRKANQWWGERNLEYSPFLFRCGE